MELAKKIQVARDTIKDLLEIYENNVLKLEENDQITQDILHQIELGSYSEGRKYYGTLRKARKDRRANKDVIEILEKFVILMNTDYCMAGNIMNGNILPMFEDAVNTVFFYDNSFYEESFIF